MFEIESSANSREAFRKKCIPLLSFQTPAFRTSCSKSKYFLIILFACVFSNAKSQCGAWFPFFSSGSYDCVSNLALGVYTINGNPPPITYTIVNAITNATFYTGVALSNTGTFIPIPVGSYNAYGASAVPGCSFTAPFSVVSPVLPANISIASTSVTCNGGNNGFASASITGTFTPPYSYTWTSGSFSSSASNLAAGPYTVTVQSSQGCIITGTVQILQPSPMNTSFSNTMTACFGGTLTTAITTTGGVGSCNYTVNGTPVAGSTVSGISAGVNTVITKDANGCLKTNTILVSQPVAPSITFTVTKPSCLYSTDGAVKSAVTNAPLAYSYTWQPTGAFSSSINNIPVGNYTLTLKDGNACVTKSVVNVSPITSMTPNVVTNPENCSAADGAFTLNMSGGNAPYTYSTISVGSHTANFLTGLSSGAYTTVVTDAGNCRDTVKFVIGNLSTVSVSVVGFNPVLCFGNCTGSVQVSVQNAVAPVTYSATGTPTTLSNIITNLCAGLITIKVIDNIGCPATTTISFPVPPVFSYSAANPAPVCIGKTFTLQAIAAGGVGAYNYVWNPGNVTGQTVSIVASGSAVYSLNVYDSNGCTLAPFTVTVNVNPALAINLNTSNSGICPGTTAQITPTITGGDGIYSYNWQPGNISAPSIFVQNITVPEYTLTVNDQCGSPAAVKIITINLFPVIIPTFSVTLNEGCEPLCTRFINTTPKAANVIWNYGDKPFEQQGSVTDYCYGKSGMFNVRLSLNDSNSCKAAFTYTNAISVFQKPSAGFVTDPGIVTLNNAQNVLIKNATVYGLNYSWFVNGTYLSNAKDINYSFSDTGCVPFRLIAVNSNNCRDTLDKAVCVIEGFNFWMPGCFTPNGDKLNDIFIPKGSGWDDKNYVFEVYNRWGKRIFHTHDMAAGWDGKTAGSLDQDDMYYWHVSLTDNQGREKDFRGFVSLLK